ncbi:MAG: hypothetical protein RMK84_18475 [Oscillochloridaceae bacterium]|nr:hypothetical protein [Chloroflexaceae bacterium]MDW8392110.1 hypothetical protein [Oscillochloridaceae bacterium]
MRQAVLEGVKVNGVGEDTAPGGLVGHGGARQAKERGQLRGAHLSPMAEFFESRGAGEFGEQRDEQQRHERVADTTELALVNERSEMPGECGQGKGEPKLFGHVELEGQGGIMHGEYLVCQMGEWRLHPYRPGVSLCLRSLLCSSPDHLNDMT